MANRYCYFRLIEMSFYVIIELLKRLNFVPTDVQGSIMSKW